MTRASAIPSQHRLRDWIQRQATICLPGALMALALTLPIYKKLLLWHRGPEAVFFELRDGFIYLSDIPTAIAIVAWLLSPFWRRVRDLPGWLTATLTALALLVTLSTFWATMPSTALYHSARLWVLLATYLIIGTTPEARGALIWGVLLSGALQAAIGIAQFVHQGSLGLLDLGEIMVRPELPGASVVTVDGLRILRAYGLTQHPNVLGGILAVTTLVGAGVVLGGRGWRGGLALVLTASSFAGLLFSFSRAAWFGLAIAGGVGLALLKWQKPNAGARPAGGPAQRTARSVHLVAVRMGILLGVLSVIGLLFAITQWPLLQPRLGLTVEGVEIRSVDERATLEAGAWTLIREHPWLGVGYANFAIALYERQPEAMAAYPIYQPVHKVPLLATAELGIPGLLLWLVLAAGPWVAIVKQRGVWLPAGGQNWHIISAAGALAALTVISWFDFYPWSGQPGRLLHWVMLALWAQSGVAKRSVE